MNDLKDLFDKSSSFRGNNIDTKEKIYKKTKLIKKRK